MTPHPEKSVSIMKFAFGSYDIRSSGLIGTILYTLFSSLCLWRTVITRIQVGRWGNVKVQFHLILLLNGILELAYFLSMLINNSYTSVAYSLHLLSMLCDFMAFSIVIYMWSTTVAYKNHAIRSFYVLLAFMSLNMACVFFSMVDLSKLPKYTYLVILTLNVYSHQ